MRQFGAVSLLLSLVGISLGPKAFAASDPAVVQIRVVQGEGAVYDTGSREPRAAVVEVTGESGQPLKGVAVSFRLPATGPAGVFPNGLTSDIVLTDSNGMAAAPRIQWNDVVGPVQIRITAAKGTARAGIVMTARLSGSPQDAEAEQDLAALAPRRGWVKTIAVIAGVAAGSALAGLVLTKREPARQAAASATTLTVGPPVITIGGPQ